jgi:uncharacterized protein YndB with AHSA1/START domain
MSEQDRELTHVRLVDAPRERVFAAWTPYGMTTPLGELDLRAGGVVRAVLRSADGTAYVNTGIFLEVVAPARSVFTDAFDEGRRRSQGPFTAAVITFEEQAGKTKVTSRVLHWSESTGAAPALERDRDAAADRLAA